MRPEIFLTVAWRQEAAGRSPINSKCNAIGDEIVDLIFTPSRNAITQFNGLGKATVFDACPPGRLADWQGAIGGENFIEP